MHGPFTGHHPRLGHHIASVGHHCRAFPQLLHGVPQSAQRRVSLRQLPHGVSFFPLSALHPLPHSPPFLLSRCFRRACRNLRSDVFHCGNCLTACPTGHQCCDGACVSTMDDPRHCGGCYNTCPADTACQLGMCGYGSSSGGSSSGSSGSSGSAGSKTGGTGSASGVGVATGESAASGDSAASGENSGDGSGGADGSGESSEGDGAEEKARAGDGNENGRESEEERRKEEWKEHVGGKVIDLDEWQKGVQESSYHLKMTKEGQEGKGKAIEEKEHSHASSEGSKGGKSVKGKGSGSSSSSSKGGGVQESSYHEEEKSSAAEAGGKPEKQPTVTGSSRQGMQGTRDMVDTGGDQMSSIHASCRVPPTTSAHNRTYTRTEL
ncbi:unnamed protein product [Closterium sp. Yama58-4]|nr:unnamed protein product [Closterium sp. Yama58-4]